MDKQQYYQYRVQSLGRPNQNNLTEDQIYAVAKQKLVNRLFDKGINNPMPSVKKPRDEKNEKYAPLQSKIAIENHLRGQQHSMPKVQENQVLPPLDQSMVSKAQNMSFEQLNTGVQPLSQKNISNNLRRQVIGGNIHHKKSSSFNDNNFSNMLAPSRNILSRGLKKRREQQFNERLDQSEMSDYQEGGLGRLGSPMKSKQYGLKAHNSSQLQLSQMQEKPSQPVQFLMDKMIGPKDQRYMPKQHKRILRGKTHHASTMKNEDDGLDSGSDGSEVHRPITQDSQVSPAHDQKKHAKTLQSEQSQIEGGGGNEGAIFKMRDIDTFIQMVREHKLSPMEFIYLMKKKPNSNDAYNMKVVSYNYLNDNNVTNYYTLSSKGVTRYENSSPIEFLYLGDWLKERDQFNAIKNLSFFRKFRKWKTLKKWQKILFQQKNKELQTILNEKLFILNPIYQKLILKHRGLCYDFERLRFVDSNENQDTMPLEEFNQVQQNLRSEVVEQLTEYSSKLHENTRLGIKAVIDQLRLQIMNEMSNDDDQVNINNDTDQLELGNQVIDEKKEVLQSLGFPQNMSYGHRSMMRSEFVRFLRLAYLLDFICVQSLGNIYINSAEDFLKRIEKVAGCTLENNVFPGSDKFYQDFDPIFMLEFQFCEDEPQEQPRIEMETLSPEELKKNLNNFDLEMNIEIVEEQKEEDQKKDNDEKKKVINIQGLDCIQVVERWSKNQSFLPYVKGLEEWDNIIGEKWTKPESNYLNPSHWIKENPVSNIFLKEVQEILDSQFNRLQRFQAEFREIFNLYWRSKNSNLEALRNKRLRRQEKLFEWSLTTFQDNTKLMQETLIPNVQLGLFKVICSDIQKKLIPSQQNQVKILETLLIDIFNKRGQEGQNWLRSSLKGIQGMVLKIEEFVEQKQHLDSIYKELSTKREELTICDALYHLMVQRQIPTLMKDSKDIAQSIVSLESTLNVAINEAENNASKNVDRFKKQLEDYIEKLKEESLLLLESSTQEKYLHITTKLDDAVTELSDLNEKMKVAEDNMNRFTKYEEILAVQDCANFDTLLDAREELNMRYDMWRGIKEFKEISKQWSEIAFKDIDAKQIAAITDKYVRIVQKCKKNLPENRVITLLQDPVYEFKNTMPVVTALRSKYLTEAHWQEIKSILKADFDINQEDFTLQKLLNLHVGDHQEDLIDISIRAAQEDSIKQQLVQIEEQWSEINLTLKSYKDKNDLWVLSEIDELIQLFDEGLATMNNLLASRYVGPMRSWAERLQGEIILLQDIVDKWFECQKKWMYLENIFTSSDIKRDLPNETHQFEICDKFLKNLMRKTSGKPKIMLLIKWNNLLDQLIKTSDSLDVIERQLEWFLERKRKSFPRFYFLSNDELLEILAKASKLDEVEPSIGKCFEGLVKLYMKDKTTKDSISIHGMISPEGEIVPFNKQVAAKGNVEQWLDLLQKEMMETIKKLIKSGYNDYINAVQKTRQEWILKHKGQVVSTVSQILWVINTEDSIQQSKENPNSLYDWYDASVAQLQQLTYMVRGELSSLERKIIVALITTDVHNRDITEKLAINEVENQNDFLWQQQLRYYFEDEGGNEDCWIRQVMSKMQYGHEYLGAASRLVITPLTDRCWITITSAVANKLGANPAGPAGTGKTESTKDLAKGLGRLCIVFNCSEQITAMMMNKLFSGLCQQGAWSCLDEFNRIDIEVLSVIAQQLLIIRMAQLKNQDRFELEGSEIGLKPTAGVFITMNPGYAGRTELPDNLKSLFRPVAMMIPDYAMIAEIMLFAEGFENASSLSKKMVQLYKLSSEQLSQQDHYDFGMRAVKSLLVMAGSLKRQEAKLSEDIVLIRAMRDANVPKFLKDDLPLFSALIQDLFPTATLPKVSFGNLESVIHDTLRLMKLQLVSSFVLKIIQLFDTLNVRFGVMLVGPTGSGKSECYKCLAKTMTTMRKNKDPDQRYQAVDYHCLNPKSITMGELYGEVDIFTQEWKDGLGSSIIRGVNTISLEPDFDPKKSDWVVFDGPVDALWIENMNTVLDDNMTLCLANSERIKLRPVLRMLFEVQDLAVASPATVSRCGMVYLSPDDLGWFPYVESWINLKFVEESKAVENESRLILHPQVIESLKNMFQNTFESVTKHMRKFYEPFPTSSIQRATNICNFLDIFMKDFVNENTPEESMKKLNYIYGFCFIWGTSASVDSAHYDQLDIIIKDIFPSLKFPRGETIFDFYVDEETQKCFLDWQSKLIDFKYDKDLPYFNMLVPTIDTTKYSFVLSQLLNIQKPSLFTGGTGVGKSVIIQNLLYSKKDSGTNSIFLNFSAQTSSKQTQLAIESKLQKKTKTLFGARPNERIAIFIDDINMPALEQYGAQPCIELLRQLQDKGGIYDRAKLFWKNIEDSTLICAGAPPGGGRNQLHPRFVRHFHVMCLPDPSDTTLTKIFGSICREFLMSYNFNDATRKMWESCVNGTLHIYRTISRELLPIPSKFHYTFNLRDISKVFQGILQVKPAQCNSPEALTRLWIHEIQRVFQDRLVSHEDVIWFRKLTLQTCESIFGQSFLEEETFVHEEKNTSWSDIMKLDLGLNVYEEISDQNKLKKQLEEKQDDYNHNSNDKLNLVFFDQANQHILKITRVLRQPRGNAMLIGVGGSGKQSLSKLASFIMKCEVFQIELVKSYNANSFKEDMMKIMKRSGVEGVPVSFVFTDVQIAYESFLEDINNMLNTGEIPNLFSKKEDLDEVINDIRSIAIKQKRSDSPEDLWNFFVERVREKLHTILCMSPVGESLRIRTRKFPSMINCCTLDWFSNWPKEALIDVANKFLNDIDLPSQDIRDKLTTMCMEVDVDVQKYCDTFYKELKRRIYTTPKSYLDLIQLYFKLLEQKRNEVFANKKKLADGLDKLHVTNEVVATLKIEMENLQPKLEEQSIKTEQFLKQLSIDSADANQVEQQVALETQKVNDQASEIKEIADEAQTELDVAIPILKEAVDALNTINKADIAQIKGYANPPSGVQLVMEAVAILLGQNTDWSSVKTMMVDIGFIDKLKNYDKNNVPDSVLRKLRAIVNKPEFDPYHIGKQSMACKSLCLWCRAIDNYAKIAKVVEPKKRKVAELQSKLDVKLKELKIKQDELDKVKQKVQKLEKECNDTVNFKKKLEKDIEITKNRLIAAEKLTELLADEGVRWAEEIQTIDKQIEELIGNVFIAASTISYCGAFTKVYREQLVNKWIESLQIHQIPYTEGYTLENTLETPINIRDWKLHGLPNDSFSVENAVIATQCDRYPLFIDPQLEANKWIKSKEKANSLKILKFSEGHYLKSLQNSISSGFPVLIEDVTENLEPSMDSVLQKQVFDQDGRKLIRVGDKRIDFNPKFKLYMTSKMANPHYLPEIFIKTTVLNFSITFEGLQDQLLGDVMKNEKPEKEQQRDEIIVSIANAKKSLKQSQDRILEMLATAKGMILDDVELIQTLEDSKTKSAQITIDLEETSQIEAEINESRNLYTSVAIRGTVLYFVITDLSGIDPMYQYSLAYFKKLFKIAMENTDETHILEERLMLLNENITKTLFIQVCRGLFESHKKLFSFMICTSIKRQSGEISFQAWNLLIRGPQISQKDQETMVQNPDKNHFTELCWATILTASLQIHVFKDLPTNIKQNLKIWLAFIKKDNLLEAELPEGYQDISQIYKLILIRAFRPEKIMHSFSHYVAKTLGVFYDTSPTTTMEQLYNDSSFSSPIIFILSVGADPTGSLLKFARDRDKEINVISLGQGQGKKAEVLLEKAFKQGSWVLLQNCHLAKSWMPNLENLVEQFNVPQFIENENFRLFLTSMPVDYFPVSVLQNGLKQTTEAPRGLKANLKKSWQDISQDVIDSCVYKKDQFQKLLFGLTFFHAIIQERRKFGPLGFNIKYEFNESDLDISQATLKMFINVVEEEIPWEAMLYMTGHINYGGRVTDDWDRICLLSILKKYYCNEILEDKYKFSTSGIYHVPQIGQIQEFRDYIDKLPNFDDPEVFGMSENANIIFQHQESQKIIDTILSVQPRISQGGAGKSQDEIVTYMAKEFEEKLPLLLNIEKGNQDHFELSETGAYSSLTTVLLQEVEKFNRLIKVVKFTLSQLQKAIKGFVVMSQDLDDMYLAFLNNQLPPVWKKVSYASLKPLSSWFNDLIKRVSVMQTWLESQIPNAFWLSGFFFPQGFLTGVLQRHARYNRIPIDTLSFKFKVLDIEREKLYAGPKDGVYIYGLYCDGAKWDSHHDTLVDQEIGQLYCGMPIIHFIPAENYVPHDELYQCPVYKTSNRVGVLSTTGQSTNFILAVNLNSKHDKPESWTLKGTALLCQLDD